VTCALIAAKYIEIYPPSVKKFADVTGGAYTADQLKAMEVEVLSTLDWNLEFPTTFDFVERYS